MAAEHDKHMVHKDLEAKDEEMEQLRYNMQKKVTELLVLFSCSVRKRFFSDADSNCRNRPDCQYHAQRFNRTLTDLCF